MSIIRYIPVQDAFIVSGSVGKTINTGLDEILEIGYTDRFGVEGSARALLDFGNISLPESTSKATLHLYLANASNLPQPEYNIKACIVSQSWAEGYGKYADEPATTEGVCWSYRNFEQDTWDTAGGNFTPSRTYVSESFQPNDAKDINLDVLSLMQSESIEGGFILGFGDEAKAVSLKSNLSFYSKDTHTIYRPYLELQVDNSEYDSFLEPIESEQINISTEGFKSEYSVQDNVRLQLRISPKYPTRTYTTCSLYSNDHILPSGSYWGIRNEHTREMVVDFCEGTKISANDSGSYFDLNMNLLEPGRYYRLLYQVNLDNNRRIIFDNRNIFKVVKNG